MMLYVSPHHTRVGGVRWTNLQQAAASVLFARSRARFKLARAVPDVGTYRSTTDRSARSQIGGRTSGER